MHTAIKTGVKWSGMLGTISTGIPHLIASTCELPTPITYTEWMFLLILDTQQQPHSLHLHEEILLATIIMIINQLKAITEPNNKHMKEKLW